MSETSGPGHPAAANRALPQLRILGIVFCAAGFTGLVFAVLGTEIGGLYLKVAYALAGLAQAGVAVRLSGWPGWPAVLAAGLLYALLGITLWAMGELTTLFMVRLFIFIWVIGSLVVIGASYAYLGLLHKPAPGWQVVTACGVVAVLLGLAPLFTGLLALDLLRGLFAAHLLAAGIAFWHLAGMAPRNP